MEEAGEVAKADTVEEISSEIGDVLEVIDHIIDIYGLDIGKIQEIKRKNKKELESLIGNLKLFGLKWVMKIHQLVIIYQRQISIQKLKLTASNLICGNLDK